MADSVNLEPPRAEGGPRRGAGGGRAGHLVRLSDTLDMILSSRGTVEGS